MGRKLKALDPLSEDLTPEQIDALKKYQDDFWFQIYMQAEIYFDLEIYSEAATRFEVYLTKFSKASQAHKRLAQIAHFQNHYDKAIYHSHRAYEYRSDADSVVLLITLLLEYGLEKQAEDILTGFAKEYPESKREIIGHAYLNEVPLSFIKRCWVKSRCPNIKVLSSTPNNVLDTVK